MSSHHVNHRRRSILGPTLRLYSKESDIGEVFFLRNISSPQLLLLNPVYISSFDRSSRLLGIACSVPQRQPISVNPLTLGFGHQGLKRDTPRNCCLRAKQASGGLFDDGGLDWSCNTICLFGYTSWVIGDIFLPLQKTKSRSVATTMIPVVQF